MAEMNDLLSKNLCMRCAATASWTAETASERNSGSDGSTGSPLATTALMPTLGGILTKTERKCARS
eukprot:3162357-Pleurochrysis_carterae.AAC.1